MDKKINFIVDFLYAIFIMVLIYVGIKYFLPAILPFVIGFAIAYLLRPVAIYINKKTKIPKRFCAVLVILLFYTVAVGMIWFFAANLAGQITIFAGYLPDIYEKYIINGGGTIYSAIYNTIYKYLPQASVGINSFIETFSGVAKEFVSALSTQGVQLVTSFAAKTPVYMVAVMFTIISSVLISRDYEGVKNIIKAGVSKKWHKILSQMADFMKNTVFSMAKGYIIIMFITFLELAFGLWLLSVEGFLPISGLIALLDILPLIGSGLVLIPWGVWCILTGNYFLGWGIIILFGVISLVRNIIEPKIIGDQIGLGPLATITAMFFGLKAVGFGGMIIAPIVLLWLIKFVKLSDESA